MVQIALDHIYKKYDNAADYSVTDFNLHIKDQEFIVFVGPSGCGKSTTLRMIAGLEDISQGELKIDDQIVNDESPKDRDIAMVFQNYALYPHMSVYDNMAFGLKLRKYDKSEIDQRVALGRSIVRDAPIFLMDEPLSNLDAKLRISMRAEIAKLHQRLKTTTIYVTHDQTEAMTMADRIVVMKDGKVQQIGTPQEVYDNPTNVFVGSFIGAPAMNFFHVTLQDDKIRENDGNFTLQVPAGCLKTLNNKGYQGKELVFGIRPEHMHTENTFLETFPNAVVPATVVVSELLGAETQLYSKIGDTEVVAKVDARDFKKTGEQFNIGFDLNRAHFFDPETEVSVY